MESETKPTTPKKKSYFTVFLEFMGGDMLPTEKIKRAMPFGILITVLFIVIIGNGFAGQDQIIRIGQLKKELKDAHYESLLRSAELMEKSRQSKVEEYIGKSNSHLLPTVIPPYQLKK
ncbi:MAG: hypothetical protein LBM61_02400 [Prevotellaceae bacterium]|jgi:hypothetical protein|nr:hypothetical protein [Prevotellaceae bacterium]